MALTSGTVLWFNAPKGFGFLSVPEKPDVFCHYTAIQSEGYKIIKEGEVVEFEIVVGYKGLPQAANVRVIRQTTRHTTRPLTAPAPTPISQYN